MQKRNSIGINFSPQLYLQKHLHKEAAKEEFNWHKVSLIHSMGTTPANTDGKSSLNTSYQLTTTISSSIRIDKFQKTIVTTPTIAEFTKYILLWHKPAGNYTSEQ